MARALLAEGEFIEIFVDTPLAVAERRDPRDSTSARAAGHLKNFTGIDSPYEPPQSPELHLDMARLSPEVAAGELADYVLHRQR